MTWIRNCSARDSTTFDILRACGGGEIKYLDEALHTVKNLMPYSIVNMKITAASTVSKTVDGIGSQTIVPGQTTGSLLHAGLGQVAGLCL